MSVHENWHHEATPRGGLCPSSWRQLPPLAPTDRGGARPPRAIDSLCSVRFEPAATQSGPNPRRLRSLDATMSTQPAPIAQVLGREILDSRGNPTVEVDVILADGTLGRAAVPSGASTGAYEAVELRDGDKTRYLGKRRQQGRRERQRRAGQGRRRPRPGRPGRARSGDDRRRRHREQSEARRQRDPRRLLAAAKAAAAAHGLPLYRYLGGTNARVLPVPMANIINGGKHADNNIDFQEFMVMPLGAKRSPRASGWSPRSSTTSRACSRRPATTRPSATRGASPPTSTTRRQSSTSSTPSTRRATRPAATATSPSRWTAPAPSCSTRGARRATSSGSRTPTSSSAARK